MGRMVMNFLENPSIKQIHCMGIGGIGVSGLAEILLKKGYRVTGSDITNNPMISRLQQMGAQISLQHEPNNIRHADALIYSSAITAQNPELMAAKRAGIPVIQRGQLLAELMQNYAGIAVSGTHGKTTTTGLMAYTLLEGGLDPTYAIGGMLNNQSSPVRVGEGKYFIAEADESDASFLHMHPKIAVITNIDADHLSAYNEDFNQLIESFLEFLNNLPCNLSGERVAILGIDDPTVQKLMPKISTPLIFRKKE